MNKQTINTILLTLVTVVAQAQITLKGSIINERGEKVEYVSVGLEEDSIGTISDANGNFTIEIPANRKNDLVFTHVSFQKAIVPLRNIRQWAATDSHDEGQSGRIGRSRSKQEEQTTENRWEGHQWTDGIIPWKGQG